MKIYDEQFFKDISDYDDEICIYKLNWDEKKMLRLGNAVVYSSSEYKESLDFLENGEIYFIYNDDFDEDSRFESVSSFHIFKEDDVVYYTYSSNTDPTMNDYEVVLKSCIDSGMSLKDSFEVADL